MIRRDFLRSILFGSTALAAALVGGKASEPPLAHDGAALAHGLLNLTGTDVPNKRASHTDRRSVSPSSCKNSIADLLRMREQTLAYMLALDPDRLLHNFRVNANLPSVADAILDTANGWRGHYVGHFLSASAQMYASAADTRIKAKAEAMVAELAKCQAALGDKGYLSAFPESSFDGLESGMPCAAYGMRCTRLWPDRWMSTKVGKMRRRCRCWKAWRRGPIGALAEFPKNKCSARCKRNSAG